MTVSRRLGKYTSLYSLATISVTSGTLDYDIWKWGGCRLSICQWLAHPISSADLWPLIRWPEWSSRSRSPPPRCRRGRTATCPDSPSTRRSRARCTVRPPTAGCPPQACVSWHAATLWRPVHCNIDNVTVTVLNQYDVTAASVCRPHRCARLAFILFLSPLVKTMTSYANIRNKYKVLSKSQYLL